MSSKIVNYLQIFTKYSIFHSPIAKNYSKVKTPRLAIIRKKFQKGKKVLTRIVSAFKNVFQKAKIATYENNTFLEKFLNNYNSISKNRAMQITTVFGCDRVLMETLSSVSLHLYQITKEGKTKATHYPLYRVLHLQPNSAITSVTWRKMIMHDININGTHYSQIVRNRKGEVIAIYPLLHSAMQVFQDTKGNTAYIYYSAKFGKVEIPKSKLLIIYAIPNENGTAGISPIQRVMREFKYASTLDTFGQNFFDKGANGSGIFTKEGTLSEEAFIRLRNSIAENLVGLEKSGKPMLLEEGLTFQRLTTANNESQFLESKKFSKEQIASIFRVPLHLLNGLDNATFSNIEQLSQEFIQFTMLPHFVTIEVEMTCSLLTKAEQNNYEIKFNVDALLRGDYKTRTEGHANLWRIGALSQNEIRAYEGKNKIKYGDKYYVEMNMTPTDQSKENK